LHRLASAEHGIEAAASLYAGDRLRDVIPATELGGRGILIPGDATPGEEIAEAERGFEVAPSLGEAVGRWLSGS
jgi:FMN phosphatase YigB (HAD superfamily)